MLGLEIVDGLMDAIQPVCQVIQLMQPLLLVKDVAKEVYSLVCWNLCIDSWTVYQSICQVIQSRLLVFLPLLLVKDVAKEVHSVAWVGNCGWIEPVCQVIQLI